MRIQKLASFSAEDLNCTGKDPDLWESTNPEEVRYCLSQCQACPAREACLADAIAEEASNGRHTVQRDVFGIRGGVLPAERSVMVREEFWRLREEGLL